jgi:hypothetical protein
MELALPSLIPVRQGDVNSSGGGIFVRSAGSRSLKHRAIATSTDVEAPFGAPGRDASIGSLVHATGGGGDRPGARPILDEVREAYQPAYEIAWGRLRNRSSTNVRGSNRKRGSVPEV